MQIDWFTFGAQILNFLLLVWLLKRFLYGPIVNAMAEREQQIANRFEEAREKREAAEAEMAEYREKREALESARDEKLAEAEEAARDRRRELIDEAREEVDRLEQQWRDALRRERDTFLKELAERASRETVDLARQGLRDLADADLEREVVRVFLDRLSSLPSDRRETLVEAVRADDGDVTIHTAFDLTDEDREQLVGRLQSVTDIPISAEVDRDGTIGFGIEIRAGGHKIAWSLSSYFADMEERIRSRIDDEMRTGAAAPVEDSAGNGLEQAKTDSTAD